MERFKLWDKTSNITILGGTVLTPAEVYQQFPHIPATDDVMLEYLGDMVGGIDSLSILRQIYTVDESLSAEDAMAEIIDKKLNPPEPEPTQEETTRADVDYLALMMGVDL